MGEGPRLIDSTNVSKKAVQVANARVISKNGTISVMNSSSQPVTVHSGDSLAKMELLKSSGGVAIGCLSTEECCESISRGVLSPSVHAQRSVVSPSVHASHQKKRPNSGNYHKGWVHRGLSSVERKRVFDLLVKSEPVFPHKNEIGKTKVLQHQIHTGEAQPV